MHAVHFLSGCNIEDSQQFGDRDTGCSSCGSTSRRRRRTLEEAAGQLRRRRDSFEMDWQISPGAAPCGTPDHGASTRTASTTCCSARRTGALPVEVAGRRLQPHGLRGARRLIRIPFRHIPVTPDTKAAGRGELLELVEETARSGRARPLHAGPLRRLCKRSRPGDQHPPLVPAELQGRPALPPGHDRGVKLVGATAHYVTADLDEGPIIEQDVERVDHAPRPEQLSRSAATWSARSLSRAVKWHAETPRTAQRPPHGGLRASPPRSVRRRAPRSRCA